MKKRLIALILAVVMCMLAFVSCGEYDYQNAKLEKFSTVDANFVNALKALVIEDGEYTTDNEEREKQVMDMIYRSLANSDNLERDEKKEGTPDKIDLLYYCYYATYEKEVGEGEEKEKKTYLFDFDFSYIDKSTDKSATGTSSMLPVVKSDNEYMPYLQYGLHDNAENELTTEIIKALEGKDIKDYAYDYDTSKDTAVKEGDFVIVTFTYKYTDEEGEITTKTVTDLPVQVNGEGYVKPEAVKDLEEFEEFLKALVGKKLTVKTTSAYKTPTASVEPKDGDDNKDETPATPIAEYTNATVSGIVKSQPLVIEDLKNFTSDDKTVKFKDVFGTEHDLTDAELTYYVYPAYYIDVEYTAEAVLNVFYGSQITTDVLDVFTSEDYTAKGKDDEGKDVTYSMKELVEAFAKAQKTFETKKAAFEKAESNYEAAKEDLDEAKKAYETAKTNLEKATTDLATAENTTKEKLDAKTAAEKAVEEADKAHNENPTTETKEALDAANKALEDAKKAYDDAVAAENKAKDYKTQCEKTLNGDPEGKTEALKNGAVGELKDAWNAFTKAYKTLEGKATEEVTPEAIRKACYDDARKALDSAKAEYDKVKDGTDDTKKKDALASYYEAWLTYKAAHDLLPDLEEAVIPDALKDYKPEENEVKGARAEYAEARTERDEAVDLALAATNTKGEFVDAKVMEEFEQFVRETNEDAYFQEVNEKLLKAVADLIDSSITVDINKLPRKAVSEVYEKLYEEYKREFFTSASSATEGTVYDTYGGDFKLYLMAKTSTTSYSDAKKSLRTTAAGYVAEIVKIYRAAEVLDAAYGNVIYTDEEFKAEHNKSEYDRKYRDNYEMTAAYYAMYGLSAYLPNMVTEQDLRIAEQFDKLFDRLMTVERDADGRVVANDKNIFKYTMIGYSVEESAD